MLAITSFKGTASAATDAARYLDDTAEMPRDERAGPEDYYSKEKGGTVWHGSQRVFEALDINSASAPTNEQRKALMLGEHPNGRGTMPHSSNSAAIVQSTETRRFGWDLTFNAPKSVSIEWALADAETRQAIQSAHDEAVKAAMDETSALALFTSRAGKGGAEKIENVETIASLHRHGTSRELDMHLHTHAFVYNVGLCDDGKFRTLETGDLYSHKMYLGALYRAQLAESMSKLGYVIEQDKDSFRLSGIGAKAEKHFSKRAEQINEYIKEHGTTSATGKQVARLTTRAGKQELSADEVRPLWNEQAREIGYTSPARGAGEAQAEYDREKFIRSLTEQQSLFTELHAKKALMVAFQHAGLGADAAKAEMESLKSSGRLVALSEAGNKKGGQLYSTPEHMQVERDMIESAITLRHSNRAGLDYRHQLEKFELDKGFNLSQEQRDAIAEMTRAGDLSMIRGVAGAGKTTAAEVAYRAYKADGREVVGMAIAAKAARGLKDATDRQVSIAAFLLKTQSAIREAEDLMKAGQHERAERIKQRLPNSKTVLMIDEAGMIGSRTMHDLLEIGKKTGAKIILIGDEKQIQPIEAGGAFAALQKYAIPDRAEITEIRRQKTEAGRAISEAFGSGRVQEGFDILEDHQLVKYHNDANAARDATVAAWASNRAEGIDIEQNIMLAALRKDVQVLNDGARAAIGLADKGIRVSTEYGAREFAAGDRVIFRKNKNDAEKLTNGDLGTVIDVRMNENGKGAILKIKRDIDSKELTINSEEYQTLDHGYALTTHAAQGVTVDRAVIFASAETQLSSNELGYVQMSRQRGDSKTAGLDVIAYADVSHDEISERASMTDAIKKRVIACYSTSSSKGTTLDYKPKRSGEREVERE